MGGEITVVERERERERERVMHIGKKKRDKLTERGEKIIKNFNIFIFHFWPYRAIFETSLFICAKRFGI